MPLTTLAKQLRGGRPNMVALGALAALVGIPHSATIAAAESILKKKGDDAVATAIAAIGCGAEAAGELPRWDMPVLDTTPRGERWAVTGNEAAACGAIRAGVRYAAGYPITPATEILEWLASALPEVGGMLVQAEDELASVAQIIGASFGGVPALTATSGPGLALMAESIGLAVSAEIPIVVVDVMRGGPSTGIPTKSEQSDLNIALHGLHGDAPHLVLAPLSIPDCLFTTQWAVQLAEALQTPAIVLSDQFLGQTRAIIDRPADLSFVAKRETAGTINGGYARYALTDSGVSPMAIPGLPGGQYTADGLEHTEHGIPSTSARDHVDQLDKRWRKMERYDFGDHWAEIAGHGDTAIITWGSTSGCVRESLRRIPRWESQFRLIAIRLLSPHRPEHLRAALRGVERIVVVEQSQSGQFVEYLRAKYELPGELKSVSEPGAVPVRPDTVYRQLVG